MVVGRRSAAAAAILLDCREKPGSKSNVGGSRLPRTLEAWIDI
jgi:hypothetical protein